MIIPKDCEYWVMRQRTSMPGPAGYVDVIEHNYDMIRPYLPQRVATILDIGCGLGGIHVYLRKHYPDAALALLDGDGDDTRTGWQPDLAPFNSRAATETFLAANGISFSRWHDVGTRERLSADLVISLASWGYHYPIETYDAHGYCIADLRVGHEAPRGTIIRPYRKRNLCAWTQ